MRTGEFITSANRPRPTPSPADRRDAHRVEILGRLHGHVVSLDLEVVLREISLGGLSMESAVPFPVGAVHELRVALGDGSPVVLRGAVVYSRPTPGSNGPRFVTGVRFVDDDSDMPDPTVGDIIDRLT